MEKKLNQNNFITIADWMISDFDFNTRELLCYAIIYGFSQDGESRFSGSLSYLANWLNISRRDNVLRYLDALVKKGAVTKNKIETSVKRWCEYSAVTKRGEAKCFDHIVILPWMIEELGLQDKELILYALIYGFSRAGSQSFFTGNNSYMAKWLGIDKSNVKRYTSSLIQKGLIERTEDKDGFRYKALYPSNNKEGGGQIEYTMVTGEEKNNNQSECAPGQIEYTPGQSEGLGMVKLSTNNLCFNTLNKNLSIDSDLHNNNITCPIQEPEEDKISVVVDEINNFVFSFYTFTEKEQAILETKKGDDISVLKKYRNSSIDIPKIMSSYAEKYFLFAESRSDGCRLPKKASDLLLKTLTLKRYEKYTNIINCLDADEIFEMYLQAYDLLNPEKWIGKKEIRTSVDAYFIGLVDNILKSR